MRIMMDEVTFGGNSANCNYSPIEKLLYFTYTNRGLDSSLKCNRDLTEKIPWQVFESQGIFEGDDSNVLK